jgi:hypothetical protein
MRASEIGPGGPVCVPIPAGNRAFQRDSSGGGRRSGTWGRWPDRLPARRPVSHPTARRSSPSFQLARGAAEYRAGRFTEAATSLEKSRNPSIDAPRVREQADVFLAMALWRLDRSDEARAALAEADRLHVEWERAVASHHGWPGFFWRERVIVEIAMREAEMTTGPATLPDDVFARP